MSPVGQQSPTVLLTRAEDIYRPAVQHHVAKHLDTAWGPEWFDVLVEKELRQSRREVPLSKRESYVEKLDFVRTGKKSASTRLECWEIAGTAWRYGDLFSAAWSGKRNKRRLNEVRRWMNLKRHDPDELTYEGVMNTAIPTMIETLDLLQDSAPAEELREFRTERGPDGSLVDQELARLVGRAWSQVTPRRSGETETIWLQRLAAFERDATATDVDEHSKDGLTGVQLEIERLLERYEEIAPANDEQQQEVRREYLRQQVIEERHSAEEMGISPATLAAWRRVQLRRERLELDLQSLEDCALEAMLASEVVLEIEQLYAWWHHQVDRETARLGARWGGDTGTRRRRRTQHPPARMDGRAFGRMA